MFHANGFVRVKIKPFIEQKFGRWFGNRMPVGDSVVLNQRSTYIWPVKAGFLVVVIIILMMIGATNYQNNLAFLLTFLLIGIGLVSIVFTFKNLQGIRFTCLPVNEVFAQEPFSIQLSLQSEVGQTHYSVGIGEKQLKPVFCDVPDTGNTTITLNLSAARRGHWSLPRLMVTSQFPFGWLKTWAYFRFETPILVYPKAVEPPLIVEQRAGDNEDEDGHKQSGSDDLYGLKSYSQGEPLSRVDWKAFARERGMYVREFVSYQNQQLCFSWLDFPNSDLESRLSYLTYMVLQAASQNMQYSLQLPNQMIELDEGEQHRKNCLRALALVDENTAGVEKGSVQ